MFGHKDKSAVSERTLSPKEQMIQGVETLAAGKELVFRLGAIYVKPFITIVQNPEYPAKGKKFVAFQEGAGSDNRPGGKRGKFWETNKSKDIASWVLEREGHVYQG